MSLWIPFGGLALFALASFIGGYIGTRAGLRTRDERQRVPFILGQAEEDPASSVSHRPPLEVIFPVSGREMGESISKVFRYSLGTHESLKAVQHYLEVLARRVREPMSDEEIEATLGEIRQQLSAGRERQEP